ncbi:MAG: hypothetical protein V3U28_05050 [Candidatus Acidoferrales bacterium]
MAGGEGGVVLSGARLVWRRQRVLWWIYGVNLLLGLFATVPVASRLGSVLNRSLAAERLVEGFDLTAYIELVAHPSAPLAGGEAGSLFFSLVFFVFMLFVTGGLLEVYRRDQTLSPGEFFQACGSYFWRFVRLLIFLVIVLIVVGIGAGLVGAGLDRLAEDSPREKLGFWLDVGGGLVLLLVLMTVRLWFDMAQVRAVAEEERKMRRTFLRAFKLTFGNFPSLFWLYLRISVVFWVGLAAILWVWLRVPPQAIGLSFLLGQAAVLLWVGTRLWQRASETLWYQRCYPVPAALAPPEPSPAEPSVVSS